MRFAFPDKAVKFPGICVSSERYMVVWPSALDSGAIYVKVVWPAIDEPKLIDSCGQV